MPADPARLDRLGITEHPTSGCCGMRYRATAWGVMCPRPRYTWRWMSRACGIAGYWTLVGVSCWGCGPWIGGTRWPIRWTWTGTWWHLLAFAKPPTWLEFLTPEGE